MLKQLPDRLATSISSDWGFVTKVSEPEPQLRRNGYRDRTVIRCSLALFLLLSFGLLFSSASNGAATTYQIQAASQGTFDVTVAANGLLQDNVYNLAFQSSPSTIIRKINVKQGQRVRRGQVLASLDPIPLQYSLDFARAAVKEARRNVDSADDYAHQERLYIDAKVHAARVSVDAAQDNQNAINHQSDVLQQTTNAIIQDDEKIVDAQRRAADAQMRHSKVLRQQTIDTVCSIAATPTPSTTTPTPSEADRQSNTFDDNHHSARFECERQANYQYDADAAEAHARVVNAQEQVDKDQLALDQVNAAVNVNNVNAQGQVNVANSLIDVERENADYASALTQVTASQGQLFLALIQQNIAQYNLACTILIAPHDGIVTGINGTVYGSAGIPPNSALGNSAAPSGVFIQIVDPSSMNQIAVNVSEADICKVKPGQLVQFTLKAFGYRQFSARVDTITPNGINNTGSIMYPVTMDIDAKSLHGLETYPNMTATTTIAVLHDSNVLTIPSSALDFSHMTSTSLNPVVSQQQMQDAQHRADNMLSQMTLQDPKLALQPLPPIATFVIEQTGNSQSYEARPIVLLGITNGSSYEVLQGLNTGEPVITGITTVKKTP